MKKEILSVMALLSAVLAVGCAGQKRVVPMRDISGMAKIDENTYLVANDQKAHKVEQPQLGIVRVAPATAPGQAIAYQPLTIHGWPEEEPVPSDIEAVTAIPGKPDQVLVAESGYYKGRFGRIFYLKLIEKDGQLHAQFLAIFRPFRAVDHEYTTPSGQQVEGIAAFSFGRSRIGLLLARRGSNEQGAELVWGELTGLDTDRVRFDESGKTPLSPGYRYFGIRGAGDIFLQWDTEGTRAEIWCVATNDRGDSGPFTSVIYRAGELILHGDSISVSADRAELLWRLDGIKVEALAEAPEAIPGAVLSIGTDDEQLPSLWRALMRPEVHDNEHLVMANLWVQTAAETRALYYQAYNMARERLRAALSEPTQKKRAVIVDIDETILDNSPYATRQIFMNQRYPAGWEQWTDKARAQALPGAVAFLQEAVAAGVDVFYVSNRRVAETRATLENLQSAGFPQAEAAHLFLRTDTSSKEKRRQAIRATHEIVLLMGDNLADFAHIFEKKTMSERSRLVDELQQEFGSRFIVLPNPVYGDWEGAVYEYNYRADEAEKDKMRKAALRRE